MASGVRAVTKLIILPCKEIKATGKLIPSGVPFIAPYNPSSFSFSSGTALQVKNTAGYKQGRVQDLHPENKTLSVELFLDGTGASPPLGIPTAAAFGAIGGAISNATGSKAINAEAGARAIASSVSVTAWINYFFAITANGKSFADAKKTLNINMATANDVTHESNPVKIIWGTGLFFNCKLMDATVNFKLFNQLGMPLRATISATFIEVPKSKATVQSPDLTKLHIVKAGDTLYNIAKGEYDDESYYIKIAEANGLRNYRRLIPGQELILPPIAKVEE